MEASTEEQDREQDEQRDDEREEQSEQNGSSDGAAAVGRIEEVQGVVIEAVFPEEDLPFTVALRGGMSCVLLFGIGLYIFRRLEPTVLKEI